eukprot:3713-Rhodomonas_salina.1
MPSALRLAACAHPIAGQSARPARWRALLAALTCAYSPQRCPATARLSAGHMTIALPIRAAGRVGER